MQDDLKEHGIELSQYLTRKIREKLGIRRKQVKKFKVTTDTFVQIVPKIRPSLADEVIQEFQKDSKRR